MHRGVGEGANPFPRLLHFTLDTYLMMLSIKQRGIKYPFLIVWYNSTRDRTPAFWAIGEHSTCWDIYIYIYREREGDLSKTNNLTSRLGLWNMVTAPLKRDKALSPTSVLDMKLNHLIVRLQSWKFEECAVSFHCHYSKVHPNPEW